MKKLGIICVLSAMLIACGSSAESKYTKDEMKMLELYEVLDYAENDCKNSDSLKIMLKKGFEKEHVKEYCKLDLTNKNSEHLNELIVQKVSIKDIQLYINLDNFREENIERYITSKKETIEDKVLEVNMDLDAKPYEIVHHVKGNAIDMLVNKYNALDEGYTPKDLITVKAVCDKKKDTACSSSGKQKLRKEAAEAFVRFVDSAKDEDIDIVSIASYQPYAYQEVLYTYSLSLFGDEKADEQYVRPGHNEHNTGLAVDITFNGSKFEEIAETEKYPWIVENIHEYGFILRYPKDKEDITLTKYEPYHLRYVGKKLAKQLYESDMTLEEYYGNK